jgi:hypothetical protein
MAIKTFTTGEVLTAADTNTYLANSGLVFISETNASNSATVAVANCFSATYDAYRIVITDWTAGAASGGFVIMTGTTTGYYGQTLTYSGTLTGVTTSNGVSWPLNIVTAGSTGGSGGIFELQNPFLTKNTIMQAFGSDNRTAGIFFRDARGWLNNTTSYTGFTFSSDGGNTTAKIIVYGYRKT